MPRRPLALLTALCVALGGLVAAPTATAAPPPPAAAEVLSASATASVAARARGTDLRLGRATQIRKWTGGWLVAKWRKDGKKMTGTVRFEKRVRGTWKTISRQRVVDGAVRIFVKPSKKTTYRVVRGRHSATATVTPDDYFVAFATSTEEPRLPTPRAVAPGGSTTVVVQYYKHGKLPATGALRLQKLRSGKWRTVKTVRVRDGYATVALKPASSTKYRFKTTNGKRTSDPLTVEVVPGLDKIPDQFRVTGLGEGPGVGLSQAGAYQMAREGWSAKEILDHYYTGTSTVSAPVPRQIAVQVFGPEPDELRPPINPATRFRTTGTWVLRNAAGKVLRRGTSADSIQLKGVGTKAQATVRRGKKDEAAIRRVDGFRLTYTGTAEVFAGSGVAKDGALVVTNIGGRINVVEELALTEYLYGIDEMPSAWGANGGAAALEAQAISARTYAVRRIASGRSRACDCEVYSGDREQSYQGWYKARNDHGARWVAAVDATTASATRGDLLVDADGRPVATYHFEASGGRTADSADAFGRAASHLRGVPDRFSLDAPKDARKAWTLGVRPAELAVVFGLEEGIASIEVTETYRSGQMKKVTATSSLGRTRSLTGTAEYLRHTIGLPSAWVTGIAPFTYS